MQHYDVVISALARLTCVFDLRSMLDGVQGQPPDFPSYLDGQPMINQGVFDAHVLADRPRPVLPLVLNASLQRPQRSLGTSVQARFLDSPPDLHTGLSRKQAGGHPLSGR